MARTVGDRLILDARTGDGEGQEFHRHHALLPFAAARLEPRLPQRPTLHQDAPRLGFVVGVRLDVVVGRQRGLVDDAQSGAQREGGRAERRSRHRRRGRPQRGAGPVVVDAALPATVVVPTDADRIGRHGVQFRVRGPGRLDPLLQHRLRAPAAEIRSQILNKEPPGW